MVPNVTKAGSSFKGALAYYLHDKRQGAETVRSTSERIGWTVTRNLMTNDPHLAGKVMAATAMDQDRLKREAGIKSTGRKSPNSVYAYSLAWHPDETGKIDRAEMLKAADQSLKALGAADRQALIICHTDEAHPHVHIVVNRVSMADGRMLSTSNDFKKLDSWALSYRRERGEEHRYCPARQRKADAVKRRKEGESVDFVRGEKSVPRSIEPDFAEAKALAPEQAQRVRDKQKSDDAALSLYGRSQAHRHKREWIDLADRYRFKKADIRHQASEAKCRVAEQVKEQFRPEWRELYRRQYREKTFFEKREARLSGKVENALLVIAHRRQLDPDGSRGLMGHAFNFLTSKRARAQALEKLHRIEQRHLSRAQREEIGKAHALIDADQSGLLTRAGKTYNADRAALIERQDEEKKALQAKWKQRTADRRRAFDTLKRKAASRQAAKDQEPDRASKETFTQASDTTKRRRRSRSRSRSRKIIDD